MRQIGNSGEYAAYTASGTAPANTRFALALLYSEDQTSFDNCVLAGGATPPEPEPEPEPEPPVNPNDNLLTNGGFETQLNNWYSCARADLSSVVADADSGASALSVSGGGCMYQEFDISAGDSYRMNCRARRDTAQRYTSVSLSLMNASYSALENSELPVTTSAFTDYSATLTAPAGSRYGSVVMYSEDPAVFDTCTVTVN